MDDFLILLQAKLDEAKSKGNINSNIDKIQNQLNKLKIQAEIDPKNISNLVKQLESVINQKINISNINIDINNAQKVGQKIGQAVTDSAQKAINSKNINIDKLNADVKNLTNNLNNFSSKNAGFDKFKTEINGIEVSLDSLISKLSTVNNTSDLSAIRSQANALKSAFSELSEFNKIQYSIDTEEYSTQIFKLQQQLQKFDSESGETFTKAKNSLKQMESAYLGMKLSKGDNRLKYEKEYQKALSTTDNLLSQIKSKKENELLGSGDYRRTNFVARLNNYLLKNTAMTEQSRQKIQKWITTLDSADNITRETFDKIKADFKSLNVKLRESGQLGLSAMDKIKRAWEKLGGLSILTGTLMSGWNKVKNSVSELKEIDNILTEISKTSDRTAESLKQLGDDSFETASKYGRKASDYLTSVQEMNRSGFYNEKGNTMAEQSLLAQSAGDMTEEIADKWILATNAAYGYEGEAKKINAVLDGANSITNKNSVNMTDMAEAMSTVGTSAAQAGIKVNELSSIIGTSVATTKKEGSEVGTAWKAILINLQNVSSDKIVGTLNNANASMTEMVNGTKQLRNPMEILKDLAKTYNSLDAKDPLKAEIIQSIGGKHHANILSAFLSNYDQYSKMLKDYSEGTGSAMAEAQKSANNWEGSLNRLSNTWTSTVNSFADSDAITTGINTLSGLLGIINDITSSLGSLGTLGLGAGLFAGFKNVGRDKMFSLMF